MNLGLVVAKATVGLIAGSVAIVLDAVNNLTDMLSSVVTIVGTKMANRKPDKEHPYGHGRLEYLTAMVVGLIVMFAGVTALIEAVPKIFQPELADYSVATIIVVVLAIFVKLFFGRYVKKVGEKINSASLTASGVDAMLDSLLSLGTLVGIIVALVFGVSIDGLVGTAIALFIIRSSVEILHDAELDIVGRRVDAELAKKIKKMVVKFPKVSGAYDLNLHNYGPNEIIGSVHVQLPDNMTAKEIHKLSHEISSKAYVDFGVILTVGVYAENTSSSESRKVRAKLEKLVQEHPEILQMHGFYLDAKKKFATFDLIMDYDFLDKAQVRDEIVAQLKKDFPEYNYVVVLDADVSD